MEKMKDIYQKTIRVREEQIVSQKHFDYKGSNYSCLWKRDSHKFNESLAEFNDWYQQRQHHNFNKIIRLGFNIFILFQFFMDVKDNSDLRFENLKGKQSTIYNKYVDARKKAERNEEIKKIEQDQKAQKQYLIKQQQEELNNEKHQQSKDNELSADDINESVLLITRDSKKKSNQSFVKETNGELKALSEKVEKQKQKANNTYTTYEQDMKVHEKFAKCCDFYKVFVGSVEIAKESNGTKQLFKLYFPKQYLSKFITKNIRNSLIGHVSMQSDQDRIRQFFEMSHSYRG